MGSSDREPSSGRAEADGAPPHRRRASLLALAALTLMGGCRIGDLITPSEPEPEPVNLRVQPPAVVDSVVGGNGDVRIVSLTVMPDGADSARWTATSARNSAWLVLDPRSGSAPGSIELELRSEGLEPGLYHDTVLVATGNQGDGAASVPVSFEVEEPPAPPLLPIALGQYRTDGASAIPTGGTTDEKSVVLRATLSDPDATSRVKLEVEARPVGTPFSGPTAVGDLVANGSAASVTVTGLAAGTSYHWRARGVDDLGLAGPWMSFGGNGESAPDFVVAEEPSPPDQPDAPAVPSGLAQLASDGSTPIALGATTDGTSVVLRGTVSDPDVGDQIKLEVEARPLGTGFSGATGVSGLAPTGSAVSVTLSGLAQGTSYHWRARAVDTSGRASAWVSFGGNAETAADFSVADAPPPPDTPDPPHAPASLAQLRSDGSTTIPVGGSTDETTVVLRAKVSDPDTANRLRLQVEVKPVGIAFSGTVTAQSDERANGATASVTVSGLTRVVSYHWRARTIDGTGLTGPWVSFGGNGEAAADFSVEALPPPPDEPDPPAAPTGLAQLRSDGSTAIAVGGSIEETTVVLRAAVSDPDTANRVRLQVEVRPVGTSFSGVTATSAEVGNGSTASVTVTGLTQGTSYHWRARTIDDTDRTGPWVSFGGNAETAADFSVAPPPDDPDPPAAPGALAQLRSDGSTAIATGGTTEETTVVLRASLSDPDTANRVKLEVEVRAVGTGFSGTTGASALVDNGSTASVTVTGLTQGTSYHWRARAVDDTGLAGPWVSFGGNAETAADFSVAPPPDEPDPPAAPTSLAQLRSDGSTAIALGGTTEETEVVLRAALSDPDTADRVRLEVEVRPVGTAFSGVTANSGDVDNGGTASVTVSGLSPGTSYHWRARTLDDTGRTGPWVSFGGNAEIEADFSVAPPPDDPDPPGSPTSLAQLGSDGSTVLAVGDTAAETTVVIRAALSDPDTADQVRLEIELRPLGAAFSAPTGASGLVDNGATAAVTVSGLSAGTSYHWRARAVDETDLAGAWAVFGGNAESDADFTVAPPPDEPDPPDAPTSLAQLLPDSTTALAVGDTLGGTALVLRATLTDPDTGEQIRLEVEVRPLGTAFSGPTATSGWVDNGSLAYVSVPGLSAGTSYRWRARAVDASEQAGSWVSFGENEETATDFATSG